MPEMKSLNGYEVVDAKAREDIVMLANDSFFLNFADAGDELNPKAADEAMVRFAEHLAAGNDACAQIIDSNDSIYYPTAISTYWSDDKFLIHLTKSAGNLNNLDKGWTWDTIRLWGNSTIGWKYCKLATGSFDFASKNYVDTAIDEIPDHPTKLSEFENDTDYVTDTVAKGYADATKNELKTVIVDVSNAPITGKTALDSDSSAIVERIMNDEAFHYYLKEDTNFADMYRYTTPVSRWGKTLYTLRHITAEGAEYKLVSVDYTFSKTGDVWYVQKTTTGII